MNPILYVPGALADDIGKVGLKALATTLADLAGKPVDVLTYGDTKFHGTSRLTATPRDGFMPSVFLRKLDGLLQEEVA